jgi:hypothetical protein
MPDEEILFFKSWKEPSGICIGATAAEAAPARGRTEAILMVVSDEADDAGARQLRCSA